MFCLFEASRLSSMYGWFYMPKVYFIIIVQEDGYNIYINNTISNTHKIIVTIS